MFITSSYSNPINAKYLLKMQLLHKVSNLIASSKLSITLSTQMVSKSIQLHWKAKIQGYNFRERVKVKLYKKNCQKLLQIQKKRKMRVLQQLRAKLPFVSQHKRSFLIVVAYIQPFSLPSQLVAFSNHHLSLKKWPFGLQTEYYFRQDFSPTFSLLYLFRPSNLS